MRDMSFNTVNGKYCCNGPLEQDEKLFWSKRFNTVNGKYCCNGDTVFGVMKEFPGAFQYRKR